MDRGPYLWAIFTAGWYIGTVVAWDVYNAEGLAAERWPQYSRFNICKM